MGLVVSVIAALASVGQLVVSVVVLKREPSTPARGRGSRASYDESLRGRQAARMMMLAAGFLLVAVVAYSLARSHYNELPGTEAEFRSSSAAYERQKVIGVVGVVLAGAALLLSAWSFTVLWSAKAYLAELSLVVVVAVISAGLILSFAVLPVITEAPPSREQMARFGVVPGAQSPVIAWERARMGEPELVAPEEVSPVAAHVGDLPPSVQWVPSTRVGAAWA